MPTVDIVTHYYPPIGGPGTNRMAGWANYLHELGWRVRVYTPEAAPEDPFYLEGLEAPAGPEVSRIPWFDISRPLRRRRTSGDTADDGQPAPPGLGRRAAVAVRDLLDLPDYRRGWNRRVVPQILEADPAADVLITTSPYNSTHLVGLAVKKHRDVRWLADFRDSWFQPWRERLTTPVHTWYNRHLEASVAQQADLLSFWHEAGIRDMATRLDEKPIREKATVIYNGIEPETFTTFAASPFDPDQSPLLAVFAGTIWDWRLPAGFEAGWQAFVDSADRPIELHLYGRIEPGARARLQALANELPDGAVQMHGTVPGEEAIAAEADAALLLILGSQTKETLTSKMFECVAAERPILFFGHPESAGAAYLRSVGAPGAPTEGLTAGDTEALLQRYGRALEAGTLEAFIPDSVPEGLDRRLQVQRLDERLRALLDGGDERSP